MSTTELVKLSAAEMAAKIKAKEVSSRELVEAHLAVIESAEPSVKAFLKVSADQALEQANAFDAKSDEDKAQMPELAGVPIAIKDMIVTKGIETTAASKILEGWVPPYDATVIEKLKAAGMPLLGKTNLDEFAQGSSTEHSAYQTTHNPFWRDRHGLLARPDRPVLPYGARLGPAAGSDRRTRQARFHLHSGRPASDGRRRP